MVELIYGIWVARKWIEEGKKLSKPTALHLVPRSDDELIQRMNEQRYDIGYLCICCIIKSKKLFNLFTESFYQRIEKDETQGQWILWGIGLFVFILIVLPYRKNYQ